MSGLVTNTPLTHEQADRSLTHDTFRARMNDIIPIGTARGGALWLSSDKPLP